MKYVGSKARLSKDIAQIINKLIQENNINTYIEPFVGGANLIEHIKCENKIGYDSNEYLIEMWKALQNGYIPPLEFSKEQYIEVKNNIEKYPKEYIGIVGFCATYNAGWFRRWGGQAVTKSGKVRNYYNEAIRNIFNQVPNIIDVEFVHKDFKELNPINSLIYCDPPYKSSSYEMYKDKFNHEEYYAKVREWSKNNIVVCSEYEMPNDFECIFEKQLTTSFDNKQRKNDTEKLFIHK
jgi:DNA adenine methylase